MQRILQPNEPEKPQKPAKPETGHIHKIAAAGCYTIGTVFGLAALGAMWILVYTYDDYVLRILIGSVTGLSIVIFLWFLFIQKWWFLK